MDNHTADVVIFVATAVVVAKIVEIAVMIALRGLWRCDAW